MDLLNLCMLHNHLVGAATANMTTAITGSVFFAMTDASVPIIVGGIVNSILGVATLWFAYKAKTISAESKTISAEAKVIGAEAKQISADTGKAVNGKMEEFQKLAEAFYHAKGVADEKLSAEAKAGVQAAAKAEGKAEGKAEVTKPPNGKPHQ